jgi:hypothetical protein
LKRPPTTTDARCHHASHTAETPASTVEATCRGLTPPLQPGPPPWLPRSLPRSRRQHPTTAHPRQTPARPRWRGGQEGGRPSSSFQRRRPDSSPGSLPPCYRERSPERRSTLPPSPALRAWPADVSGDGEGRGNGVGGGGGARTRLSPPWLPYRSRPEEPPPPFSARLNVSSREQLACNRT